MKRQLQGIAVLLFSILLTLVMGNEPFFDLDFSFSAIFTIIGIVGLAMVFRKEPKQ
ncbi:MAG: hypothetical protein ACOX81_04180 [Candidatus Heteroscillospira sp.]|jgi:uncharacterized membrane protein